MYTFYQTVSYKLLAPFWQKGCCLNTGLVRNIAGTFLQSVHHTQINPIFSGILVLCSTEKYGYVFPQSKYHPFLLRSQGLQHPIPAPTGSSRQKVPSHRSAVTPLLSDKAEVAMCACFHGTSVAIPWLGFSDVTDKICSHSFVSRLLPTFPMKLRDFPALTSAFPQALLGPFIVLFFVPPFASLSSPTHS